MAILDGFPAQSGVVDPVELRKMLAGLILRDTSGNARPGIFPRHSNSLVTSQATMNVSVAAFEGIAVRGGGPIFLANDGAVLVPIGAAPASNSRIDVVWFRQKENGYNGFADGSNGPELGVTAGVAAPSPTKPAIPTGATELATVLVPAGVSATNAGGVVITQTFQYTALTGAPVWVRNSTERNALPPYPEDITVRQMDNDKTYRWSPVGYNTAGWWADEDVHSWEWTYSALTVPTATLTGLGGTVALDAGRTTDSSMVTYLGAGVFNIEKKGVYLVSATVSFSASASPRAFIEVTATGASPVRSNFPADDGTGATGVFRVSADDDDISVFLYQNSGSSRTAAGRVTISRIGDIP